MPVIIHDAALNRAIERLSDYLGDTRPVMDIIGRSLRDYVRQTITMGGRNRPYAPLSEWTKRRTGRTRPLITLVDNINYSVTQTSATVFFIPPAGKKFSIQQHHEGFTTPARIGRPVMRIPLALGGAIYTRKVGPSKIPAREVWPADVEAANVAKSALLNWLRSGVNKTWR